jgi:enediyne biosynthesis protein E4
MLSPKRATVFAAIISIGVALFCLVWLGRSGRSSAVTTASAPAAVAAVPAFGPLFRDVAGPAGIRFTHTNGATGKLFFIEQMPGGCAFLDFDNDGWNDILLVQSGSPERPPLPMKRPFCALFRNRGDGTFAEVTRGSGLDRDLGYGMGATVADFDNDSYPDVFLTAFPRNYLFRNRGAQAGKVGPRFEDVSEGAGLAKTHSTGYATSAAFGDYNNDGRLDLYVCYYCPWSWQNQKVCIGPNYVRDYCFPQEYPPDIHRLYRNNGNGKFTDVSEASGITKAKARGLAVAWTDYDGDGRQDIFVASDQSPNLLWHNNGDGTFTEKAAEAGCALGDNGIVMAGMGVGVADYDRSGRESLYVSNFSGVPNALFQNRGDGLFKDICQTAGFGEPNRRFLTFGCDFLDFDNDGWRDVINANGHVFAKVEKTYPGLTLAQRKQLFRNDGTGRFQEITDPSALAALAHPTVARGLAVGDFDNDGRQDILVSNQNAPAELFHSEDRSGNAWVAFKPIGVKSNRDGTHARFSLWVDDTSAEKPQTAVVRRNASYLSSGDGRVYFGLGGARSIQRVEIRWPSGQIDELQDVKPGAIYIITEGKGITRKLSVLKSAPQKR